MMSSKEVRKTHVQQWLDVRKDQWCMRSLLVGLRSDLADYREEFFISKQDDCFIFISGTQDIYQQQQNSNTIAAIAYDN